MKHNFIKLKETPGDGACLFNSVAFGLSYYRGDNTSNLSIIRLGKKLRKNVVRTLKNEIEKNNSTFNNVIQQIIIGEMSDYDNLSNSKKISKYLRDMKKGTTWGGQLEVNVLNKLVQNEGFRGILIINEDTQKSMRYFAGSIKNKPNKDIIHITLNNVNYGGCHFSFVIPRSLV